MNEKYIPAGTDKYIYNVTFSNGQTGQCSKLEPLTKVNALKFANQKFKPGQNSKKEYISGVQVIMKK